MSDKSIQIILFDELRREMENVKRAIRAPAAPEVPGAPPAPPAALLTPLTFEEPYQYLKLEAGESGEVYFQDVPDRYVAFITRMANNWYDDTYYEVEIDGNPLYPNERRLRRALAPIDFPLEVKKIARRTIRVMAFNEDTTHHYFEFLIDGVFLDERTQFEGVP